MSRELIRFLLQTRCKFCDAGYYKIGHLRSYVSPKAYQDRTVKQSQKAAEGSCAKRDSATTKLCASKDGKKGRWKVIISVNVSCLHECVVLDLVSMCANAAENHYYRVGFRGSR